MTEHSDETGTITFGSHVDTIKRINPQKNLSSLVPSSSKLYKIEDAKKVYAEILKVQNEFLRSRDGQ